MGYSTDSYGRLCCDVCGIAGGVRRKRCPVNYCPPVALCPACRVKPEVKEQMAAYHVENRCAELSAEYAEGKARIAALHAAGERTFVAAVNEDGGVRVWFRGGRDDGTDTSALTVTREVYESLTRETTLSSIEGGI